MIDPLSATGLAYPIAKDLYRCAKRLKKAYREIQHAKESLKKVIDKIEIVAETYALFKDTMDEAKKIKDLAQTFKRHRNHRNLIQKVMSESAQIIKKLEAITKIFSPLLRNDSSDPVQRWITQFQWYRKEKSAVVPLLMDMQILQGSMNLVATLVIIQILQNSDRNAKNGRDSIHMQIKLTEIGLKKLQEDEEAQKEILKKRSATAKQDVSAVDFAREIIRIVKEEIPKLHRDQPANSPSTPVPGPPSRSSALRQHALRTPPSLDSRPDARGQVSPPLSHHTVLVIEGSEQEGMEETPPQLGPYVRMPPFGPPEAGPRPRPGRNSFDSRISVYGNEGEVTHTHLMGSAGLPQGWQRRKEES
ncbi:hypothetical protein BDW60DRAFT_219070 [Aspergillus nidulans var. acristatus]